MRFVLFLFRVEYVSVELCQQFRPSIMHRVGPTRGGWVAFSECSPVRSVLQRDPPPPRSKTIISFDTQTCKQYTGMNFFLFLPFSVAGCIVSERGGGAELCLHVPVRGRNDLHPTMGSRDRPGKRCLRCVRVHHQR